MTDYANPYAPPPPPAAPMGPPRTSGMAIWALILNLLGAFCCLGLTCIIGVPLAIGALVSIGNSAGRLTGRAMAWIGLIVGLLAIVFYACIGIFLVPGIVESMQKTADQADTFLQHLSNRDFAAAHALTESGEMSVDDIRQQYEEAAAQYGDLQSWSVTGSEGNEDGRRSDWARISLTYSLTWKDGSTSVGTVVVVAEGMAFLGGDVEPEVRSFSLK